MRKLVFYSLLAVTIFVVSYAVMRINDTFRITVPLSMMIFCFGSPALAIFKQSLGKLQSISDYKEAIRRLENSRTVDPDKDTEKE